MNNVLLFGGTTEGRLLVDFCSEMGIHTTVCVTTKYGASLLTQSPYTKILVGKKDAAAMEQIIKEEEYDCVVDATHPYAVEVTANLVNVCKKVKCSYYRVIRNSTNVEYGTWVDSVEEAVAWFNDSKHRYDDRGNLSKLLVTTGSKELPALCKLEDYKERCVVRFLPNKEIEEACLKLGYKKEQMILAKGPFSREENCKHMKEFHVQYLLTKDSGNTGGFEEKLQAAKDCEIYPVVIRRPREDGYTLETIKEILVTGGAI